MEMEMEMEIDKDMAQIMKELEEPEYEVMNVLSNNKVHYYKKYNFKMMDLATMISRPKNVAKDEAPLFNLTKFTGTSRDKINNPPISTNFVILDFDNGYTYKEFEKKYDKYSYFLYSSKSSTKENNKFRVIMPLRYDYSEMSYKYLLAKFFKNYDPTCAQLTRFYYLPNLGEDYHSRWNIGIDIDFNLDIINFKANCKITEDLKRAEEEKMDKLTTKPFISKNVLNNCKVQKYLNTPYTKLQGNGTSNTDLYTAICVCEAANDIETLDLVVAKAKRESWVEHEINLKIRKAQEFLRRC